VALDEQNGAFGFINVDARLAVCGWGTHCTH
jgi:hypothetical protein